MSALTNYVKHLVHVSGLIGRATEDDDLFCQESPPRCSTSYLRFGRLQCGPRRRWTRQDGNRAKLQNAIEDEDSPDLLDRLDKIDEAFCQRIRTRLGWVLDRHRQSAEPLHRAALAESEQRGLGLHVHLGEAIKGYRELLSGYADFEWQERKDALARFDSIVADLRDIVPPPPAPKKSERETWTVESADVAMKGKLTADPSLATQSPRKWAKLIGCSEGTVRKVLLSRFWVNAVARSSATPKAVSLTTRLESTLGQNDPALDALINEQRADDESSSDRRRVRARRRV